MRFSKVTIVLIIGLCLTEASGKAVDDVTTSPNADDIDDTEKEELGDEDLPILPPIILLDFGNGTDDENTTSEEKSKRTVNGGLGYGLDNNNLQHTPRRYNYYFPAGKSGTTVSIEESISPFLPKTIIERVQPNRFSHSPNVNTQTHNQEYQYQNVQSKSESVFGLRTKPQKPSPNFEYQSYLTTPKPVSSFAIQNSGYGSTTQSPLSFGATETVRYVTPSPKFASSFNYDGYATGQRQNIQSDVDSHGFPSASRTAESSTIGPANYDHYYQSELSNGPRYTYENGVSYENKVFWKYPDGRVSDVPPQTYVETSYSDYPQSSAQQSVRSQTTRPIYEASTTENTVLSQGPVQFPTVSEQAEGEPNSFVSGDSLSSSLPQQQVYRLGYQGLLNQKQNNVAQQRKPGTGQQASHSFSRGRGTQGSKSSYHSRYQTLSKYMVNSPNPEYKGRYTTEPTVNATTPLNSFYGSEVRNYLDEKQSSKTNGLNSYSNLQYSDLLSYNPSISEYVRNPSSILNVRPTFVQAGNSLVPVIILRVDSASPIQPKASQNINLKALLQQYLIQYAKSIQELAQPSTYNLGTEPNSKVTQSPILDLIRLTQDDARPAASYNSNSYVGQSSYEASNIDQTKDFLGQYNQRPRQKVKNVQILEDPRYTSYKINN
ncbi:uncharacterized protein LOC108625462 [Ceratina calcarata]|uniref:Uncharacterized protein LOC108625462 n=1 Tax=Ceratina calcarata TaxID=156304 RepID=A0AAJ7S3I1_9HYME|nr:uncharacterized protein LOC108625462 [Ceratina calcarata]